MDKKCKKITISWELDGASTANDNYTSSFCYGDAVTLPKLSKQGASFMGWYLDKDFKTPITAENIKSTDKDITVYALFAPIVSFTIDGTPLSEFNIVISAEAELDTEYNANRMCDLFKKRTRCRLTVLKDTEPASAHEIILSNTNRKASSVLALDEYKISVKDGNLVFDAGHYEGLNEAIAKFLDIYGNPRENIEISADFSISGKTTVPLTWADDGSAETLGSKPDFTIPVKEGTYKLVWSDEFEDIWKTGEVNESKWDGKRWMDPYGVKYQSDYSTIRQENGRLSLITDLISEDSRKGPLGTKKYKMTQLSTSTTMNYRYGYLEMRAEIPFMGTGEWPSFWATSHSAKLAFEKHPGDFIEIDYFEQFSTEDTITPNLHKWGKKGYATLQSNGIGNGVAINGAKTRDYTFPSMEEARKMHTYGFLWTEHLVAFSVDGVFYFAHGISDNFDLDEGVAVGMRSFREHPITIILNNQIFSEEKGTTSGWAYNFASKIRNDMFPYFYNIEYMRLYQIDGYGDLYLKKNIK